MGNERRGREHYLGCLLGGAVGDALGGGIEFDNAEALEAKHGPEGIRDFVAAYGREGAITDDTQMTLFTAEALLRWDNARRAGRPRSPVFFAREAYLRWLHTQGIAWRPEMGKPGWLVKERGLHARRAPGNTCLAALQSGGKGTPREPANQSKGCGGVMRMAPVGLVRPGLLDPFAEGSALAAVTHGHPSGHLSAAFLAALVAELAGGAELREGIERCSRQLERELGHAETLVAVERAVSFAEGRSAGSRRDLERLGEGWVGEEALAIGLYATLTARSFEEGVLLAVNHGGDSDSTGSIAGNLLGQLHGAAAIPARWLDRLELRALIEEVALDLWRHFGEGADALSPEDGARYPS